MPYGQAGTPKPLKSAHPHAAGSFTCLWILLQLLFFSQPHQNTSTFLLCNFCSDSPFVSNLFGQGLSSLPCSSFLLLFAPLASLKLRAAGFRKGKANSSCRLLGIESAWKGWASFGILEHLHGWALRAQHCQSMCKSWAEESAYSRGERKENQERKVFPLCNVNVWTSQFVLSLYYSSFCPCWARFKF